MAGWQFRCVCCGELREAPMARPEGNVYLRCVATREWAWYEPEAFVAVTAGAPQLRDGGSRAKAPRAAKGRTPAAARSTRGAGGRRSGAAVPGTRAGARKSAKRGRKRR